jgi:hypothetical protein
VFDILVNQYVNQQVRVCQKHVYAKSTFMPKVCLCQKYVYAKSVFMSQVFYCFYYYVKSMSKVVAAAAATAATAASHSSHSSQPQQPQQPQQPATAATNKSYFGTTGGHIENERNETYFLVITYF